MTVHRLSRARVRAPRMVEIVQADAPANDPTCRSMERRAVAWMFVLCAVLAAAIVLTKVGA
jgi:hypothetical protein